MKARTGPNPFALRRGSPAHGLGHSHSHSHGAARRRSQGVAGSSAGVRRRESTGLGGDKTTGKNKGSNGPRLDPEAQRLAARRLQAEREADLRINDFNAKLQQMIRQGREALGTSVEVDVLGGAGAGVGAGGYGDGDGDGWEDD